MMVKRLEIRVQPCGCKFRFDEELDVKEEIFCKDHEKFKDKVDAKDESKLKYCWPSEEIRDTTNTN